MSNKGPNKGSTSEANQPAEVHQDIPPPTATPQQSQQSNYESDSEETKHVDMEILDTKVLTQEKLEDSSPKIPNYVEDVQDNEDEHTSNIFEEHQGEKEEQKISMLIRTT